MVSETGSKLDDLLQVVLGERTWSVSEEAGVHELTDEVLPVTLE